MMNSMPSAATTTTASSITATATTNAALLKDKKAEEPESVSSTVAAADKGEPPSAASVSAIELGLIEEDMDKKKEGFISASMEGGPPSPATVFCIRLKQPEENLRHKMSVPELCRNFSAVAWCGKLNLVACAAETCARLPSYNVKPPFWIPIHVVNPERPTESAIFNVPADSPRDSVQFIEWSPISCPRALLIGNFHGRVSIWTQPSQGPVNLVRDATCWQCEHEWRQDLAVVTKWLSGTPQYHWLPSDCTSNSKPMFEEKYLSFQPQTSARWPNFLCICSVFSSGFVQLHWSQWPATQNDATPKWFSTSKGLLGAGPSGIMAADAIVTEAGTLHVAGVPIVNPSTVVVWEVTPGPGSNFQATIRANTNNGVPPSFNPPSWVGFAPLAAYLFSWQEHLGAKHKKLSVQDTEPDDSVSLHCLPVSNFSAYVSPEAATRSTATTTWGSSVISVSFDPTQGGAVIAVVIVEGQYMSPYDPDEGPSITGWRIQRWESSCQPVVLHPVFGNPSSSLSGQSPMQPVWLMKVNKTIKSLTDFKGLQTSAAAEMLSDVHNLTDPTVGKTKKHGFDCYDVPSDIRMLADIVFSSHGGEVAVTLLHGEVHLFSGANFSPVDSFLVNVGFSVAAPAFSSSSCCLASVWHDMDTEHTLLKIMRVIPSCTNGSQSKVGSEFWERAIADRFWWSLLVGVDWWDAVGCTQSATEDGIVSLNGVIAMLDADFHSLPSVLHRHQHGPSLDRVKCRLLEGTVGQEVRALVLDMQARLLLDMLGKGIESALVHPESLITEPWHASSETLSSLDSEAMTVEPALVASIQAYVDAVLDLASHFITRLRRYASFCRTLGHAVGASAGTSNTRVMMATANHGATSSSTTQSGQNGTASSIGNAHMQTWVQGAIAKINSSADGTASMPNPMSGPSSFMPISINTGTFPGTPAVRLIGDCHFLHRLCQLLLFCLFFRRKQLPRIIGAVQRSTDSNPMKSQSISSSKGLEEINMSSRPASAAAKLEENQSNRVVQSISSTKSLDELPTRPPRFGLGNVGQGYTSEEVKVLFLILVDLCKRTAGLQHPLPVSQVGTSNIQVSLHYIDGNYTVLPEVVEASLGPHMQNMPRPRGADAAGLLLRELELHPPSEEWHKRNMFGGPWTDLDDSSLLNQASNKPNVLSNPIDISASHDHHSGSGSQGLWPRKRRLSERDAAFGLRTSVGLGGYLGVIGSRRDVVTAVWKTGLEGVWYKCVRCLRQTSAFASPNSANPTTVNEREAWWISRWAYGCPMCGGTWVRVV